MAEVIASYTEDNYNADAALAWYQGAFPQNFSRYQTFIATGDDDYELTSAKFYLKRAYDAITSDGIRCVLLKASKDYYFSSDSSSRACPGPVAISDTMSMASLSTTGYTICKFNFTGKDQVLMSSGTSWCINLEIGIDGTYGGKTICVAAKYDRDSPSLEYAGNAGNHFLTTSWVPYNQQADAYRDLIFYLYDNDGNLVTSFPTSNFTDSSDRMVITAGINNANTAYQSFSGNNVKIGAVEFFLSNSGGMQGRLRAKLYESYNYFGNDLMNPHSILAEATSVNTSILTGTMQLINFDFPTPYRLVVGDTYALALIYKGNPANPNTVHMGIKTVGTYGNMGSIGYETWWATNANSAVFYAYGTRYGRPMIFYSRGNPVIFY